MARYLEAAQGAPTLAREKPMKNPIKTPKVDKSVLSMAGEFAVAAELCRRNRYTQLTFGNQKSMDLMILSGSDRFIKIEVKSKQGSEWGNIGGIPPGGGFLVFVDFADRGDDARPDFYVLTPEEWREVAEKVTAERKSKYPGCTAHVDSRNRPVLPEQDRTGCTVVLSHIQSHRDKWLKIMDASIPLAEEPVAGPPDSTDDRGCE
jgi:hypothetical protein